MYRTCSRSFVGVLLEYVLFMVEYVLFYNDLLDNIPVAIKT